ncbi:hypothetical protein ASE01_05210 [Nocardioides sp. Root190]|uniref:protein kinase domain-containing protein n=1 Tax=Nocardioides sp. Root190 TaxID=1736488 RepID=UPI0006F6C820|nr:protein kinase [Nocardioides sp. Root190]KRB78650.1 hypothetical protein ASE01_05210 [Nocardioides sp. Root190]
MEKIGDYPIQGVIGAGGFGTVYLATDPTSGEAVAVKVLDWPEEGWRRQMFRDEAAALLSVQHPNVVRVRAVIDEPGLAAIVTDYVAGASLREVVRKAGPLDGPQALSVLWGALNGLAAVHAAGLVHADLKPENILLDETGTSRLIDFGLTSPPRQLDGPDTWIGTPAYIAPEIVLGSHIDHRSDIYATAIILFELLCGRAPYLGPNPVMTALLHVQSDIPDPRGLRPELGEPLARLCTGNLAKDPAARHQHTPAFMEALDRAATTAYGRRWAAAGSSLGALVGAVLVGLPGGAGAGLGLLGGAPVAAAGAAALGVGAAGTAATGTVGSGALAAIGGAKAVAAAASVLALVVVGTVAAVVLSAKDEAGSTAAAAGTTDTGPRIAYLGANGTHTVRPDGTDDIALGAGNGDSRWSPDGRQLAFSSGGGIHVVDADGTDPTLVTPAAVDGAAGPVWSPDGEYLAFTELSAEGRPEGVFVIGADGTRLHQVDANTHRPQWVGSDRLLVSTSPDPDALEPPPVAAKLVRADGSGGQRLFTGGTSARDHKTWFTVSPRADQVAYIGDPDPAGRGDEIRVLDLASQTSTVLSRVPDRAEQIAWSPDGESLAVVGTDLNAPDVVEDLEHYLGIIPVADGRLLDVDSDHQVLDIVWSPDGTRIAFTGGTTTWKTDDGSTSSTTTAQGIWTVAADGTDEQRVVAGYAYAPDWRAPEGDVEPVSLPSAPSVIPDPTPTTFNPPASVDGTGDVSAIAVLPLDFQTFVAEEARARYADVGDAGGPGCGRSASWVQIEVYDPRGFARGGIDACGGSVVYWVRGEDGWTQAWAGNGVPLCSEFDGTQLPVSVLPEGTWGCYTADGEFVRLPSKA